ncbi:MAG: B12-binding domain-containing radical SAM protein [Deltaproteobacteria bacterium HGW-Deltaproteobacteria-12]|nr:MAG: B12-binding domain-containing radical SAM protein [Deltaproteobacteria bacterium HGW-Deltaproteobacteria-12]
MRIAIIATPYPLTEIPSPPLGITYVAAAFIAAGAEVKIFDYIVGGYSKEKLGRELNDFQPDAVGAGSVTMNFYEAQKILLDVKSLNPEIITLMGGPHVSFTARESLNSYPEIDLIMLGEAEETIRELTPVLKDRSKWRNICGIAYRRDDEIINTGKRNFISDIDALPFPARHLLPVSRYRALGFPVSMITGRGCPNACIFCVGRKMVGAKVRRRRAKNVLDEMEQIIALGFERINIADDLFAADKERVKVICNGIRERGLKFTWSAFARVDTVDQEMLEYMVAAGCDSVSFGVETGNPEMLKTIKKGIKLEQVYQAVKMTKQAGMIAHASFMVGLPGETRETLAQTSELARSLDIVYGYHFLAPFPGTTVREKVHKYDLQILTNDWAKYDANDAIVRTSSITPDELREFVARFDAEIENDWQRQLKGYKEGTNTPLENMQVEGHWRLQLSYQVLKEDLIEKYGNIDRAAFQGSPGRALAELCSRIEKHTGADAAVVRKTISNFVNRGYLQAAVSDTGCTYSWSS